MTSISSSQLSTAGNNRPTSNDRQYTVQRGDSLSKIASQHGVGLDELIRANPQIANPNLIHAGQQVTLPGRGGDGATAAPSTTAPAPTAPEAQREYMVKPGDTMTHIAKDHRVTLNELVAANPEVRDPSRIRPGDMLQIPASGQAPRSNDRAPAPNGGVVARPPDSDVQATLARGATGEGVREVQGRLNELGYNAGTADGEFGPRTQGAVRDFQTANGLETTGAVDNATRQRLFSSDAKPASAIQPGEGGAAPRLERYPPGSDAARSLFREAAQRYGLPERWADSPALHNLLRSESDGWVGIPNYTYGSRKTDHSQWSSVHDELRNGRITARSSATGLGQLLLGNVDRYYPNGRAGIGDPVQEAAGMMRYIQDRYGTPEEAWRRYNTLHEGY